MHEQRRFNKQSEEETLKKIAEAEAVNKGLKPGPMGTMNRIKDREMVEMMRYPQKMNAYSYQKEYGKVLE